MREKHPFEIFRSNSELVLAWRAVMEMPITQNVLRLLRDNGPEFVQAPYGLTEIDIARRYGDVIGYARHHQLLEDLSKMWPLLSDLPETQYTEELPPEVQ